MTEGPSSFRTTLAWRWRLAVLTLQGELAAAPLRASAIPVLWCALCVAAPLLLRISPTRQAFAFYLLDSATEPAALLLCAASLVDVLAARSRRDPLAWLFPPAFQPRALRWMRVARWLRVFRWPIGFLAAAALLARPDVVAAGALLLLPPLALLIALTVAWTLTPPAPRASILRQGRFSVFFRRRRGVDAAGWAAVHETFATSGARPLALLLFPLLLAAPAGASARDVLALGLTYLPAMLAAAVWRQTGRVRRGLARWLQPSRRDALRVTWWSWRYVAFATLLVGLLLRFRQLA